MSTEILISPEEYKAQGQKAYEKEMMAKRAKRKEIAPTHEVYPGRKLVKPEIENMYDGAVVKREIWEPLLGGELHELWNEVLVEPGDEVFLPGSTGLRAALGVYVYDENTGLADENHTSDIDVLATDGPVRERLKASKFQQKKASYATKMSVGNREIGVINEEDLIEGNLSAAHTMVNWAETHEWESAYDAEFAQQISDEAKRSIERLEQLKEHPGSIEDFQIINSVFEQEVVGMRLRRNDQNELEAVIVDPRGFFESQEVQNSMEGFKKTGSFSGISTRLPNNECVKMGLLQAFNIMEGVEFDSKIPLYAIEAIPRMIKTESELDVAMHSFIEEIDFFNTLHRVSKRLVDGEEIFKIRGMEEMTSGGAETVREWFAEKVQESFARSCCSNEFTAFENTFLNLPLAGLFSAELAEAFEEHYEAIPPNNTFLTLARMNGKLLATDGGIAAMKFGAFASKKYGAREIALHNVSDENAAEQMEDDTPFIFMEKERYPTGMSEMMGMVFVAVGWDPEADEAKIDKVLANWKPSGILKTAWTRGDVDFDLGLDKEKVLAEMKEALENNKEAIAELDSAKAARPE